MKINVCDPCLIEGFIVPTQRRLKLRQGGMSVSVDCCPRHADELRKKSVGAEEMAQITHNAFISAIDIDGKTFIRKM